MVSPDQTANLLSWVKSQVSKARNDRIPFERQWYLNLAFYYGRQWVDWQGSGNFDFARLYEPAKMRHQVRLVSNKIRTRVLRTVAKLNQERPRGFVQPATADDEDIAAARAAEKIYQHVADEQVNLDEVMKEADWWSVICGTSFVKTYYNDYMVDITGNMGRIEVDVLSPFHVFVPNLESTDIERQSWVTHVCTRTVAEIETMYGVRLEPTVNSGTGSVLNDKFTHAIGINQNTAKDAVLYYEMYVKPNVHQDYPDGVKICWANDQILKVYDGAGEQIIDEQTGEPVKIASPFVNGIEYPITRRCHYPSGKFYGDSPVTDMISLQQEYNRGRSQLIENRNLMSRPPWLAVSGSIVNPQSIQGRPGEFIYYNPVGPPPQPVTMPGVPSYVIEDLSMTLRDIDEASQNTEMSRGDVPGRVEAATAIGYLQEEADQIISLAARNKEMAIERIGGQILYYVNTYWSAERSFAVVGRNTVFEAETFSSQSTKGNTNFKIWPGSGNPLSRSAKQALIMELMKGGFIPVGKGLQYLTLGDAAKLYEELQIDTQQAERENVQMSKGQPAEILPSYDHVVHIQVHDDATKRQEFHTLDQQIQAMHRYHTYGHLQMLAQMHNIPVDPMMVQQEEQTRQMLDQQMAQMTPPGQPPMQSFYIDPILELQYRRFYNMLVANGGVPPTVMGQTQASTPNPQGV